jgi:hypothetical protein
VHPDRCIDRRSLHLNVMNKFPFTPPPELIEEWIEIAKPEPWKQPPNPNVLCALAAEWGYLQHEKSLLDAIHSIVPPIDFEPDDDDD